MTPVDRQATHALRPSRSGVGTSSDAAQAIAGAVEMVVKIAAVFFA